MQPDEGAAAAASGALDAKPNEETSLLLKIYICCVMED